MQELGNARESGRLQFTLAVRWRMGWVETSSKIRSTEFSSVDGDKLWRRSWENLVVK